jgi:hypothetical protein
VQNIGIALLYEALSTPFGVILKVEDVEKARQRLYALRKLERERNPGDESLAALAFIPAPDQPGHLWIVKKEPKP